MINETLTEKYINENGEFIATPRGTSMFPMLRHCRDTVYLKKFNGSLKRLDVPLYKRADNALVLHRCLKVNGDGTYLMCGDNQTVLELVHKSQIIAVMEGFYRDEKYISKNNLIYKMYSWFWSMSLWLRKQMQRVMYRFVDLKKVREYPNNQK